MAGGRNIRFFLMQHIYVCVCGVRVCVVCVCGVVFVRMIFVCVVCVVWCVWCVCGVCGVLVVFCFCECGGVVLVSV